MIYENLHSQHKHLFQREEFAFGHEETCLHNFSSHCQACQFRVFLWVFTRFFLFFWQGWDILWKKQAVFYCFFSFEGGPWFWQRKLWPIKSVFIITTQPIVLLLGSTSNFGVYSLSNIIKLRKPQVLFKKPTFEIKAILCNQETWELSPFLGKFKVPLAYTCSLSNYRYHAFTKVEEKFCNRYFFVKKFFFRKKENFQPFMLIRLL